MGSAGKFVRHDMGTVRPYLYGPNDLLDFVTEVFGAEALERNVTGKGAHVEARIGDSVIVLELGEPPTTATRASVYVYVEDVDAAYQRALQTGATSLAEPQDKPYGERNAGVKDMFGNIWWIGATLGAD